MEIKTILLMGSARILVSLQCMHAFMPATCGNTSKTMNGNVLQLHMDLAGIGVSLNTPEVEVLYLLLDGIRSKVTSGKVRRTMEICIRSIQV